MNDEPNKQGTDTSSVDDGENKNTGTLPVDNNGGENKTGTPTDDNGGFYKTFKTQEDFDNHSAGILHNAQKKAKKELLEKLGLKPDEEEKLSELKKMYDASLTDSEKQAKRLDDLTTKVAELEKDVAEKEAIISALTKVSGKDIGDVSKYVKMAKGLVSDDVSIDDALNEVFSMVKGKEPEKKTGTPTGEPPVVNTKDSTGTNPFKKETYNLTEQGKLLREDIVKARQLYTEANGKAPTW